MTGAEIRQKFLRYFQEREHRIVPSSSLIPERDPTLMFTNAGMVQFKRLFLGEDLREDPRATTVQKCMRVSGKHNDLENVGRTARHHTFFEMLGNFSFGDYFKREAIVYAWDLLTRVFEISPDRLVVSVFREDDEAWNLWRKEIGLAENRIFRLGEKENFWQMGETGPCGPCSEIHWIVDLDAFRAGADPSAEGYLEIWNLVFMQSEQDANGNREPLPKPSIDTGMGLERLATLLQGVESNYDTDLFQPLIQEAARIAGRPPGSSEAIDVSLKVVADHARAVTFLIGDGVLPTNEGRGYVLRRVLRRAARHGLLLGIEEPFLWQVAGRVVDEMGEAYCELVERRPFIEQTIRREEERFSKTLGRGLELLEQEITRMSEKHPRSLSGEVVFKLYDTFGFPVDLTEDILTGRGLDFNRSAFDACMRQQRERARAAWKGSGQSAPPEVYGDLAGPVRCTFIGYEQLNGEGHVVALLRDGQPVPQISEGDRAEVIVDVTPFYAESGGQVGDVGEIEGPDGRFMVDDTQKPVDGLIVQIGHVSLGTLRTGDPVRMSVDAEARAATVRNHSATHLCHWALREVLGPQVTQAGSLVSPERLRFDFSFDRPLSEDELCGVEDRVNGLVLRNLPGHVEEKSYAQAIEDGAIAIFEEKYGDSVRVVQFGPSTELCGGTHARATGDIGCFRIFAQSAVGAGVRRMEAHTGFGAIQQARSEQRYLRDASNLLRAAPAELAGRVERLLERQRELERELEKIRAQSRRAGGGDPMQQVEQIAGVSVVATRVDDASPKELRSMVDELKRSLGSGVVLLISVQGPKVALAVGVTADLTGTFRAGDLAKQIAEQLGGSGGGRPDFAQAGGNRIDAIPEALNRLKELVAAGGSTSG